ncbi:MAG: hypothetical protein AABY22_22400 [Nanoarchaeota archaeon]
MDNNSIMVIHGGGVYKDKKKALERLVENILKLPETTKNRLVLENCELSYSIEELLPISEKLKVPLVIDFHHDNINPSSNPPDHYFERVFKVWKDRDIKIKIHVSNSAEGVKETDSKTARRKHSDYVKYLHKPVYNIKMPVDVMLECKLKEKSIFLLRDIGIS